MANRTIFLDVAADCVSGDYDAPEWATMTADFIMNQAITYGIVATMTDPSGPGGGNPVFKFEGPEAALRRYVKDNFEMDDEDFDDLVEPT